MSARNLPHLAKRMRWAARIICLIVTVFGATMLIGEAVTEFISQGFVTTSIEGGLLVMIGLVALAGCVIIWWRDLPASILLVVTSAGLGVHIGIFAGRNQIIVWSILGLPYLVASMLLFISHHLSGQQR